MKKYWINKCIITPEGEKMPKGFELHVGQEVSRIIVPSDLYGDPNPLYEEEIENSQETFSATYEDGNPVHIEDGEILGIDLDEYRNQFRF